MKVLVTGVTGFIGSHVIKELLKESDEIVTVNSVYIQDEEVPNIQVMKIK